MLVFLAAAAAVAVRSAAAAPTNDAFAAAQTITGTTASVTGTNIGATRERNEPTQGRGGGHTVWYSWTAPAAGATKLDTFGSALDTVVSVYRGTRVDRLTLVATDDDSAGGGASKVTFTAAAGVTYRIQVDGVFTATNTFTLVLNRKAPANDNFAAAQAIAGASGSVSGDTTAATAEPGEPAPQYYAVRYSVWYRWTAPSTGMFWFQPQDVGGMYPHATVWSGGSLTSLTQVALGTTYESGKGLFRATAGQSYSIQVDGGGGYWWEGQGRFTLNWAQATPPANDDFANAQTISGLAGTVQGTTWAASAEYGEPDHAFAAPLSSLWYRWTASYRASMSFTSTGSRYDTRLAVYRGSSLATLRRFVPYWDSFRDAYVWDVKAGDVLLIALDRSPSAPTGTVVLNWSAFAPENDAFADRWQIGGLHGTLSRSTVGATKEPGEPPHAGAAGGASVWYSWPRGEAGTVTIDTVGSSFDTVLAAYTGTLVSALTPLTSDDNSGGGTASRISFRVDGTAEIVIALDGKGGAIGDYVLNWTFQPDRPANDDFANAQLVSQERGHINGRTTGATAESGEPAHAETPATKSVWYRWVAPADGRAEFDTFDWRPDDPWFYFPDTTFDSRVAVYRGDTLGSLVLVAANDDWGGARYSRVSFPVHAGAEYRIAVDVARGDPGIFSLNWNVGPVNDDFVAPTILSGASGTVDGTNEHATWEGTDGGDISERDGGGNVWFLWKTPASGVVSFRVQGSAPQPDIDVGVGSNLALLQWLRLGAFTVDGNAVTATWSATAGTVYRIEVESDGWGPFLASWGPGTLPPPAPSGRPANDDFAAAQAITGSTGSVSGDNRGATTEAAEPYPTDAVDCTYCASYASVWYRWTAPAAGTYTFQAVSPTSNVTLAAYAGTALDRLDELSSDAGASTNPAGTPSTIRVGANAGETISLLVSSPDVTYSPGQFTLSWSPTSGAPANDLLATPQVLTGASGSVDAANTAASRQPGEPAHAGAHGGASLWFAWTAPASGQVSFQTTTSGFDSVLAVYRADTLAEVTSNNNAIAGDATYDSRVVFAATVGVRYLVALDSTWALHYCTCGVGSFTLSWRQPSSPPNDNFANAADLGTYWSAFDGKDDNFGATRESGEPTHAGVAGGTSVWFKWAPSSLNRTVTVSTRGSDFDTVVAVYTGSSLTTLTQVAADDDSGGNGTSERQFVASTAGPYWIAVDGKAGAQGHIVLSVNLSGAPPNDRFENALPLTTSSGSYSGWIQYATSDEGQPVPNEFQCCQSVWFRWTAPSTGTWHFDLDGTTADATVGLYTGTRPSNLVTIAEGGVFEHDIDVPVVAGQAYVIMVVGEVVSTDDYQGLYTLNWRPSGAPANDLYASALTLSGSSGSVTQSSAGASRESLEPLIAGSAGGASLWYRWTAPANGTLALDTAGSGFDDVVGVYTGSSLSTLQPVKENDDFGGEATAYVRARVTAGTTYSIAVDGSRLGPNDDLPAGSVKLAWTFATPPANDPFASALLLSGASDSLTGSNAGALSEPGEPPHGDRATGASVWYAWTAPSSGNWKLDSSASATPIVVGVYTGSTLGALSVVRRSDDLGDRTTTFAFAATAGTTYRIAVDGDARAAGPFTLSWSPVAPPNDAFGAAEQLSGSSGTARAATVGATKEAGEPSHAGFPGGASVWYRWTAPASGLFAVDTVGSDFDTLLGVYTGTSVGALTQVAASDDADGATTGTVRFEAVAGTTYRIAVDGKAAATGNAVLNWRPAPQPANDDFAQAELIGGRQGLVAATTLGATREPGEPDHVGAGGTHSVWYRYRAPADGSVVFTLSNVTFDAVLAVYTGSSVSALTTVAAGTKANFAVTAGATYLLAVDGAGGAAGAFRLDWRLPPANDFFASPQAISGASGSVDGTTEGATGEAADGSDANSVWYRWTAPTTGTFVFAVPALQYPPAIAVGVGDTFAARQPGGHWRDPGRVGVTAGVSYWIEVTPNSWTAKPGPFTLTWKQATDAPPNDNVPTAQTISGASGTTSGSSVGASREPGEPYLSGSGHSVWFRWTAPASGLLSVTTQGSTYDTYLAAYTGTTVANLQPVTLTSHVTTGGWPGYDNIAFNVVAGTSYLLDVDGDGYGSYRMLWSLDSGGTGSGTWNDMFANAVVLTGTNGVVDGTNVGATKEAGEPNHAGNAGGHSVWYVWTAPATQPAGFQTYCALDTLLAVYTGSAVNALTLVASNDNASLSCVGSVLSFSAVKGVTYRIAVDGKNGATGSFSLQWSGQTVDTTPPTTTISGPSGVVSTHDATFSFVSEAGATFQCSLDGAAFTACTSPVTYTGLTTGTHTFSVRATDTAGNVENPPMSRTWTIAASPGNDAFAAATVVTGSVGSVEGSLAGATREAGDPFPSDPATLWYRWTAPRSGVAELGAPGVDIDAFTGSTLATLTAVPRLPATDSAPLRFNATAGATYSIVVAGSGPLSFRLGWRLPPANDLVSAPAILSGSSGSWTGDNFAATGGAGDPSPIGGRGGASIWFRWTAPATGTLQLDTLGSDAALDTILGVYTNSPYNDSYSQLLLRGADDDGGGAGKSLLKLPVYEGTDYLIAVDGVGGANGNVELNWSLTVAVVATPPTVTLTSPPDGARVGGTVTLTATASDADGITQVEFLVNGAVVGNDRTDPYSVLWDTKTLPDGPATVTARAIDGSSAAAVTAARTLVVDNTPPDTTITSGPSSTSTSTSASFEFTSNESDVTFQCSLDLGAFGACTSPKSYSDLASGQHTFQVAALDAAGNSDPSPATQTWTVASTAPAPSAPSNDAFASPTALSGSTGSTTGDTTGATRESGEPAIAGNGGGHSVWFSWTAPAEGSVTVDTSGSGFDTALAAYTGTALSALTKVGENNDASSTDRTSSITFTATAGTAYLLQLDGWDGASGAYTLHWAFTATTTGGTTTPTPTAPGDTGTGGTEPPASDSGGGSGAGGTTSSDTTEPAQPGATVAP